MSESVFQYHEEPFWWKEHGYSATVAQVLQAAATLITQGDGLTSAYLQAANLVKPILRRRMSLRQRLYGYCVLTMAYGADNQFALALRWVDRALHLTLQIQMRRGQIELLLHRAMLHRAVSQLSEAAEDVRLSLAVLDELDELHTHMDQPPTTEPDLRLSLLSHLAMYEYFAAQHETLRQTLDAAWQWVVNDPSRVQLEIADLEWVQALLYRIQRQPERALRHALKACAIYRQEGSIVSQDRIEFLAADITLEWAESTLADADRNALVVLARSHLRRAERLAKEMSDKPGQLLAHLARIRYRRLTNSPVDRIKDLQAVLRQAQALQDETLISQTLITLGDERLLQGAKGDAQAYYRQALAAVAHSEVKVLQLLAQRALEWSVDADADEAIDATDEANKDEG